MLKGFADLQGTEDYFMNICKSDNRELALIVKYYK
jgi:hypothetical protein